MNKIIRLTSVILVLMFSLTMLFACTDNNGDKPTYEEDPDKTLTETNILLANNGLQNRPSRKSPKEGTCGA